MSINNFPALGFGTFRLTDEVALQSIKQALAVGYRHIDTAQAYGNESEVGQAIAESDLDRSDLFITTKVWNDNLSNSRFIESVQQSLVKLQTDYVDLLLIHWPAPPEGTSLQQALLNLAECKTLGLAKNIGVSNFTIAQMQEALAVLPTGQLFTNQIEVHPYLQNDKVVQFCQEHAVKVTAFMPFAVGKVLSDQTIISLAKKHQCNSAEIVVAWLNQKDIATIPSSTKKHNMVNNLRGIELTLDDEDMQSIAKLERNQREAAPDFSPNWD